MSIEAHAANRYIVVEEVEEISRKELQTAILRQDGVGDDFTLPSTPMLARHDTLFKAVRCGDELVVAICLLDIGSGAIPEGTSVELLFDTRHDHLGWFQFAFMPDGRIIRHHHQPYPEAASTAFTYPDVRDATWLSPRQGGHAGIYGSAFPAWLFVHLNLADVFGEGSVCGFNVARTHPAPYEISSWNLASGVGFQDASSFGHLYLQAPNCAVSDDIQGWCQNEQLFVTGDLSGDNEGLAFDLIDPLGQVRLVETELEDDVWRAHSWLDGTVRGRYRLVPRLPEPQTVEPEWLEIDLFREEPEPPCKPGMTYDIPDNVRAGPEPYTVKAMAAEFDLLIYHGLTRVHWIDYPPDHPVWWLENEGSKRLLYDQSFAACNDFLPVAIQLAHQRNMTFTGIFKPYDIANNYSPFKGGRALHEQLDTEDEQEGTHVLVPKSWKHRPACHAQSHPEWRPDPAMPITRLRFWSREPLPELEADDLALWVSEDNQHFEPYSGPSTLLQGDEARPHLRWTPAGNQPDPEAGAAHNWYVTWDDLTIDQPYVALEVRNPELRFVQRAHAIVEAWDAGQEMFTPLIANAGDKKAGFSFWKDWPTWRNRTPRLFEDVTWGKGVHGMTSQWLRQLPTILDAVDSGVRQYWLRNVRRILAAGADTVSIRTLCHHNNIPDYMMYAYNRHTLEAFRDRYDREPTPDDEDLQRLRELRGEAYTQFIREASQLARQVNKRFAVHLECGMEVPSSYHQRLQVHLDWERWIREGLLDEIILKWWFPRNRFIQERVLPLARAHNVAVCVTERNSSIRPHIQPTEYVGKLLSDIHDAGCNGFVFYEMANYVVRNESNIPHCHSEVFDALCRAFTATHLA